MTQNTTIQNTGDLLGFLVAQAESRKDWFGFSQQRMTAVTLAHDLAKAHAHHMTPEDIVTYALALNQEIFKRIIKG
jgi:leucyl aminopeptidase